ncbi:MAG: phosphoribosylanthranilate isomerase [Lutibacter sp.]|uniref:phosphoribosylanthranilate isomerase n=1 Tax=Lutibacter sp. TaxID=1925666 RepID=UPI0017B4EA29|nr:phosphoribosylanthranilate isomerase [Lutibacter sp.]MBT8318258.1 phosphoribosylanthranilate isomerase [Lutibacter sp.]NNJ59117.1 phosphoribosylanthranilate isomerase [Lutibacter sp.]
MKLKVCGMRNAENISELIKLKPDFIGFIFYHKSKRFVENIPQVTIPKEINKVGVFVNENEDDILDRVNQYQLNFVQLHGDETPEFCDKLGVQKAFKIIKAFSVDEAFNFDETKPFEKGCSYFLFDTKGKNYGGNGVKFNWSILQNYKGTIPFLLSGGISENDVVEVNKINHPKFMGIDVNSGFEIEPALKNIEKLKEFKNNLV